MTTVTTVDINYDDLDTLDMIDELTDRGYYVDDSKNILSNMDSEEMIDELVKRGYTVRNIDDVESLYYDAITYTGKSWQDRLNYFFEKTIGKRL